MISEHIKKASLFLQVLTKKQFFYYVLFFLITVFICAIATQYLFFSYSHDLMYQIKKIETLSNKAQKILAEQERLFAEKKKLQELFLKDKTFTDIKVYFEQFYKEQGLVPVKGWDTTQREMSPQHTEVLLNATFKGLSMQKVVGILDAFQKKEVVYVKGLTIRSEANKQIAVDILLATALLKQPIE